MCIRDSSTAATSAAAASAAAASSRCCLCSGDLGIEIPLIAHHVQVEIPPIYMSKFSLFVMMKENMDSLCA